MPVHKLQIANLGPFDEIDFEFDPQVNVFVGPNNSGKSTVLMALAHVAVPLFVFPKKLFRSERARVPVLKWTPDRKTKYFETALAEFPAMSRVGKLVYWSEIDKRAGYGCFIPALRSNTDYRAEAPIADGISNGSREQMQKMLAQEMAGAKARSSPNASVVNDEEIIQKMINLDYRSYREKKPAIRHIVDRVAAIASEITEGFPLRFAGVEEDDDGLYPEFETPDGKVPINVLSQGTQSIIQWLGLLLIGYAEYYDFPENLEEKPGVVIIDEIDAHMHPSWQRRILPALSRNFPGLQIFCSSHSPFVLAGLKAGQAQLLKRDAKGKVVVSRNQGDLVGWSMDEILRNFLDITNPTDLHTSENIERLQELRGKKRLTRKQKEELQHLRETLPRDLLAGPAASEIEQIAERIRNPAARSTSRRKTPPAKKTAKKTPAARTRRSGAKRPGRQR